MEQIQMPKCNHHPNNELMTVHCEVCSTCTRENKKTCFDEKGLERHKERNSTEEEVVLRTLLLETEIDSLQELEEWKVTTRQESQDLRECIIAHLDTIQRRSLVIMEDIYTKEKQMQRQNRQNITQFRRRGIDLGKLGNAMDESGENDNGDKDSLDRLNLRNKRRPALNSEMKTILEVVEYISKSKSDINSDMIIGVLTKLENAVIEKEQRRSHDFSSDFVEN
ncbi:hypothetical protein ACJMK2_041119 [Sinanodonta woodiana]|uniref:Uncharacterized protein n=1 Tax=Sinanodonta woodiana TaxID=1069815 RepID=A0ABD3W335_SINWO